MSTISTHILDTALGQPAAGIEVQLDRNEGDTFRRLAESVTNSDGRIAEWPRASDFAPGEYRLTFQVAAYFAASERDAFYRSVTIDFLLTGAATHYHVPLLLAPYGYSTYRGS